MMLLMRLRLHHLKSKEPRLRDWNSNCVCCYRLSTSFLKSKEPRLRDWNVKTHHRSTLMTWLEIKRTSITRLKRLTLLPFPLSAFPLEIKRTSITRLKQDLHTAVFREPDISLKSKEPRLRDWNNSQPRGCAYMRHTLLEIKRTSITRLKPNVRVHDDRRCRFAWNQKNLDYEIETQ